MGWILKHWKNHCRWSGNDFFNVFDQLGCHYREIISIYRKSDPQKSTHRWFSQHFSKSRDFFWIPGIKITIFRFSTDFSTDHHQSTSVITHLSSHKSSCEIVWKIDSSQFCINKHTINTRKCDRCCDWKWFFYVLILCRLQAWREMIKFWWH